MRRNADKRVFTRDNNMDPGNPLKGAKIVPIKRKTQADVEKEKQSKKKKTGKKK